MTEKTLLEEIRASDESLWSVTHEKGIGHFLTTLKAFKTQKELRHYITTLNPI